MGEIDMAKINGIIYDMGLQDYIEFVCGLGYTEK